MGDHLHDSETGRNPGPNYPGLATGIERITFINGTVRGEHSASCGFPEGDPLSVFAMFLIAYCWGHWVTLALNCTPFAFADNLEVTSGSTTQLRYSFGRLKDFCSAFGLTLSVDKCWFWSTTTGGRKQIVDFTIDGKSLPLRYHAANLGATLQYSGKRSVALRKKRFHEGIKRLARLRALPIGFHRKSALLKQGVWPQSLHACETQRVPKTAWKTLRSRAADSLGFPKTGRSPFLVLSCLGAQILDPQFTAILQRIRNLRLFLKHVPQMISTILSNLRRSDSRKVSGPSWLVVSDLDSIGVNHLGELLFDFEGIPFHVLLSPMAAIQQVIGMAWRDSVARQVQHRKDLEELLTLHPLHHRGSKLDQRRLKLVRSLRVGQHFSSDVLQHWTSDPSCPFCSAPDSRLHRFESCPFFQTVRSRHFLLFQIWYDLPRFTRAYGLYSEEPLQRPFWCFLAALQSPPRPVCVTAERRLLFVDGSCSYPAHAFIRVASSAVIRPLDSHEYVIEYADVLPGQYQTIQRAELWAGYCAISMYSNVQVFTDSAYFHNGINVMLDTLRMHKEVLLPQENQDIWLKVWERISTSDPDSVLVTKVKAHRSWRNLLSPVERYVSCFNDRVDSVAKTVLPSFSAACPIYRELVGSYFRTFEIKGMVEAFHADCADKSLSTHSERNHDSELPPESMSVPREMQLLTPRPDIGPCIDKQSAVTNRYLHIMVTWLANREWFTCNSDGSVTDTSWFEVFVHFVSDTSTIPPFEFVPFGGSEKIRILPGDHEDWMLSMPRVHRSFKRWRSDLAFLERRYGILVPGVRLPVVQRIVSGNHKLSGIQARFVLHRPELSLELFRALELSKKLSAVSLPLLVSV